MTSVGGQFFITDNNLLTNLTPLENLVSIGGIMNIINNASLTHLTGLENIESNSISDLSIYNNSQLSECDIQSICEYLMSPNGSINIYDNATGCNSQLEVENECSNNCLPEGIEFETQASIDDFQTNYPGCTEIEGNVTIGKYMNSSNITNVDGLNVLTDIGGYLDIRLNNDLTSLSGFSNLNSVGDLLSVFNNDALTDLSGLDQVSNVGEKLYITYNDALIDLTGLSSLTFVGGDVVIAENTLLPDLAGLDNLSTIGGGLEIRLNEVLTSISALGNLTSIGAHLWIGGNYILPNLEGLEGLTFIDGYLEVTYNYALLNLSGLDNMTSIGGYLYIRDNDDLVNLTGLDNLNSIGESMEMRNNDALEDLTALEGLNSIGAEFRIWDNDILTSLYGLDNIEANSISDLYINDNASLSICDIESVCGYLADPSGAVYIQNNASGCADQEEVEEACFNEIEEIEGNNTFSISPNPCSDFITLKVTISDPGIVLFEFFDLTGTKVKSISDSDGIKGIYETEIDFSDLSAGIYFCVITTKDGKINRKIIKI